MKPLTNQDKNQEIMQMTIRLPLIAIATLGMLLSCSESPSTAGSQAIDKAVMIDRAVMMNGCVYQLSQGKVIKTCG